MVEISKLIKVVPTGKGSRKGHKSSKKPASMTWVSGVMDDFIAKLPEEVKNIIEVPSDIRQYMLAHHKLKLVDVLMLRLDERKRRVAQTRCNRVLRDELCSAFPLLSSMDLTSPELSFLKDVEHLPPQPHLPLALKQQDLEDMLLAAQKIARGKQARPSSPPPALVLKAIPQHLPERVNGVLLRDAGGGDMGDGGGVGEGSALGRYLGANAGLSKDIMAHSSG